MKVEIIADLAFCLIAVGLFTLVLCVLGFIVEHIIPERITDKIMKTMFGELPD